ncbi:MAG: cobamide remodeling phosphodiesterase CbiR [Pseudomonadota bacterium]
MRIGTTSYIYPADIITNVRRLAGRVDDIEIVLFDVDDEENPLPDRSVLDELIALASEFDMTYTVHLPMDLKLADRENTRSIDKAREVIEVMCGIRPWGFVVHLEGNGRTEGEEASEWVDNACRSLEALSSAVDDPRLLCAENLENQEPWMTTAVVGRTSVSYCVDIGHLWKRGLDPMFYLDMWLPRARVVHLHGYSGKDHRRLSLMPESALDPVVERLTDGFRGVVTLEVFSEQNWKDSLECLAKSSTRVRGRSRNGTAGDTRTTERLEPVGRNRTPNSRP